MPGEAPAHRRCMMHSNELIPVPATSLELRADRLRLAVAAYLQSEGENDEDDVVELIASHYVDALRSDPDAADAPQTRGRARDMLVRAGDRAVMLAAPAEALRYFTQALDFTDTVGALAEEEGHHPALQTEWARTTVTWWTHKIKGLHRNDFIMAGKTDELYLH